MKLAPILLLFIVIGLYFGTFTRGFTWHDRPLIEEAADLTLRDVPGLFSGPVAAPDHEGGLQYRPMSRLTLVLDQALWGSKNMWRHIENAMLHYLVALLFYMVVLEALGDVRTALFSSLIFAFHPLAVEPVNSVMARDGTLAALFMMLSLLAVIRAREGRGRLGAASLCLFALSVLSLESSLVLCIFLAAMMFLSRDDRLRGSASIVSAFLLFAAAYFALRTLLHGVEMSGEFLRPSWDAPGKMLYAFYQYIKILLLPFSLNAGYVSGSVDIVSPEWLVALMALAAMVAAALLPRTPESVRAACIWVLVFYIPFSNLVPFAGIPVSDRYVYLAIPGVCLLLGWGASALYDRNLYFGSLLLAGVLVVSGVTAHRQNIVWTNDFTFWENAVKRSPSSAYANYNLGRIHDEINSRAMAITYYTAAIEADPGYYRPHLGLGGLYRRVERYDRAVLHYEMALLVAPEVKWINLPLGDTFMDLGRWDRAVASYKRYLEHDPGNPEAFYKIAVAFREKEDYTSALEYFNEALSQRPGYAMARYELSRLFLKLDNTQGARHELNLALLIKPDYTEARKLLNEIEE